jgi:hypothetical protein
MYDYNNCNNFTTPYWWGAWSEGPSIAIAITTCLLI